MSVSGGSSTSNTNAPGSAGAKGKGPTVHMYLGMRLARRRDRGAKPDAPNQPRPSLPPVSPSPCVRLALAIALERAVAPQRGQASSPPPCVSVSCFFFFFYRVAARQQR